MSIYIKRIICIVLIFILVFAGLVVASHVLEEKHRSMQVDTYYDLPRDSVDVLFVGSSRYVRSMASNIIYKETGISSYNRSTELISAQNQYLYVLDSFKTQKPKVVFLSAGRLNTGYNDQRDMHFHFGLAKIRLSLDKLQVALKYQTESDTMKALDIMLPVFKYHYRWNKLDYRDFFTYSNIETRGQDAYWKIYDFDKGEKDFYGRIDPDAKTEVSYDPIVKEYLDKTIEYCKKQGARVVICDAPSKFWNQEKHDASAAIAQEHDVKYLDCNLDENLRKVGDDMDTDWHDDHEHLNGWGAYKFALFIGDYLEDNFDLPDYRGSDNTISLDLDKNYEEYYDRYHMFLPEELEKPAGYDLDNVKKMKAIPKISLLPSSGSDIYSQFEKSLNKSGLDYASDDIDVKNAKGKTGKRYDLADGTCVLLVEYKHGSYGHSLASHKRSLDFEEYGNFSIIDPVSKTGFIMAFDGTKTKEQAMLLTNIYNALE